MESVMTGRFSSTAPNMSNIPRSEADKCILIPNIFRTVTRWLFTYCTNVVYICGDVHGNFVDFSQKLHLLKMQHPLKHIYVFVCGDFGHWPKYDFGTLVVPNDVAVYFCPGNHEDWDDLDEIAGMTNFGKTFKLANPCYEGDVYFCDFGCVITVLGKSFMFCGGADSIDKAFRKEGVSWFPQEVITEADMEKLPRFTDVDIVISHTCPTELASKIKQCVNTFRGEKVNDPSNDKLSKILRDYKPKQWFFGHWHVPFTADVNDCKFLCLSDIDDYHSNWMVRYE